GPKTSSAHTGSRTASTPAPSGSTPTACSPTMCPTAASARAASDGRTAWKASTPTCKPNRSGSNSLATAATRSNSADPKGDPHDNHLRYPHDQPGGGADPARRTAGNQRAPGTAEPRTQCAAGAD